MPDYGHDLQFATFPEPVATPAQSAVEVSVLSEKWGYDLVMFRDHPHRPDHLDVLTLMSSGCGPNDDYSCGADCAEHIGAISHDCGESGCEPRSPLGRQV